MKTIFLNLLLSLSFLLMNIGNALSQQNHEYVDLGLPSGTLWATCNVGANNPWECGDYFAWGETSTKTTYNWSTYKYANGDYKKLIKYCKEYGDNGYTDSLKVLGPNDDAATANWGSNWRMPTAEELSELRNNCYWVWTKKTDKQGHKYFGYMVYKALEPIEKGVKVSKGKKPKAAYTESVPHIFLPVAGYKWDINTSSINTNGYYWTSSLFFGSSVSARCLFLDSTSVFDNDWDSRFYGYSVRPVMCKN